MSELFGNLPDVSLNEHDFFAVPFPGNYAGGIGFNPANELVAGGILAANDDDLVFS